jgi:uncharacterized protein YkwD
MRKAIRRAVLSVVPLLLTTAIPWCSAHAGGADNRLRTYVAGLARPPLVAPAVGYFYTVLSGDTLWDIAAAHGITVSALTAANKLADPGLLRPGQTLWVPAPHPAGVSPSVRAPAIAEAAKDRDSAEAPRTATSSTSPAVVPEAPALPAGKETWPLEMLTLINESRAAEGLPALSWSPELARAAQAHAEDCAGRNRGGHTSSDGALLSDRLAREGAAVLRASENWAYAQSVQHAYALWWNEASGHDPHRRNILDPKYTEIGIGVASSVWGTYFVADFGSR